MRDEAPGVLVFVAAIGLSFILQQPLGLLRAALEPRSVDGLLGILAMPFLHGDLAHLTGNLVPLTVLLLLLAGSQARSARVVTTLLLGSGVLLWLTGAEQSRYIGASMLVFGLLAFLMLSGIFERRLVPILVALLVLVLYGGTALRGLLDFQAGVSEFAHFCGAAVGALLAWTMTRRKRR